MKNKKQKDWKVPNISEKGAAEMAQAVHFAFGDESVDDFIGKVSDVAEEAQRRRAKTQEQSRAE